MHFNLLISLWSVLCYHSIYFIHRISGYRYWIRLFSSFFHLIVNSLLHTILVYCVSIIWLFSFIHKLIWLLWNLLILWSEIDLSWRWGKIWRLQNRFPCLLCCWWRWNLSYHLLPFCICIYFRFQIFIIPSLNSYLIKPSVIYSKALMLKD